MATIVTTVTTVAVVVVVKNVCLSSSSPIVRCDNVIGAGATRAVVTAVERCENLTRVITCTTTAGVTQCTTTTIVITVVVVLVVLLSFFRWSQMSFEWRRHYRGEEALESGTVVSRHILLLLLIVILVVVVVVAVVIIIVTIAGRIRAYVCLAALLAVVFG